MALKDRFGWLNGLVLLWAGCVAMLSFWLFRRHGFDDPYITYRYAGNLAQGRGFVYNLHEPVLSTTTPLYALVLAAAALLRLDLPLTSNAIGCASAAVGGWALWRLGRLGRAPTAAVAGLVLLPTFPHLLRTLGAETLFYLMLVLLGFLAYEQRRYLPAAAALALATLTRADGILAGAILGVDFLLNRRQPIPWRGLLLYVGLTAPWFVFAWLYFGAPLPVTWFAKQQQGTLAGSQSFFEGFFYYGSGYWLQPFYWPHFALAALGLWRALARDQRALLLPAWSLLYFVAYTLLGVTRYFWYYAPLVPGFVVLVALGVEVISRLVRRFAGRRVRLGVVTLLVCLLLAAQLRSLNMLRYQNDTRLEIYRAVGEWLRAHTPPHASVGTLEVGIIGYYAERRMIDYAGLIQPETALQLTPATSYGDAAHWAVDHFRPDYLVLHAGLFPGLEQDPAVLTRCRQIETFTRPEYQSRLVVYACDWVAQ